MVVVVRKRKKNIGFPFFFFWTFAIATKTVLQTISIPVRGDSERKKAQ